MEWRVLGYFSLGDGDVRRRIPTTDWPIPRSVALYAVSVRGSPLQSALACITARGGRRELVAAGGRGGVDHGKAITYVFGIGLVGGVRIKCAYSRRISRGRGCFMSRSSFHKALLYVLSAPNTGVLTHTPTAARKVVGWG